MGLRISHGCWDNPYSLFRSWREDLTRCVGRTVFDDDDRVTEKTVQGIWNFKPNDVIDVLLCHSDCDYSIPHRFCSPLADRLEEIAVLQNDQFAEKTSQFVKGLRNAHMLCEDVRFE